MDNVLYESERGERGERIIFVAAEPAGADIDGIVLDILVVARGKYCVEYSDLTRRELLNDGAPMDADEVLATIRRILDELAELAELEPDAENEAPAGLKRVDARFSYNDHDREGYVRARAIATYADSVFGVDWGFLAADLPAHHAQNPDLLHVEVENYDNTNGDFSVLISREAYERCLSAPWRELVEEVGIDAR